jgi:hypothetical protein
MMQRLSEKLRLWGDALAGMDDPLGEYLLSLEERLRQLEGEVEQLRKLPSANAATAKTMSSTVPLQEHKHNPYPRAKDLG